MLVASPGILVRANDCREGTPTSFPKHHGWIRVISLAAANAKSLAQRANRHLTKAPVGDEFRRAICQQVLTANCLFSFRECIQNTADRRGAEELSAGHISERM